MALAVGFLWVDTDHRLRTVAALTGAKPGEASPPLPDSDSPSGFAAGQHRLVLPTAATDGYHWLLLTERSLAGEGLRLRSTDVDNAPFGREIHWSSLPRWWLMALAWGRAQLPPHPSLPLALEDVAAGAAPLALALFLPMLTALVVRRWGGLAAAALPLGWVAAFPLYETSMAGVVDHHGFAAMASSVALLSLLLGGAGWVSAGGPAGPEKTGRGRSPTPAQAGPGPTTQPDFSHTHPPPPPTALRYAVLSGVAGGAGTWLSATTTLPLLAAALMGGVLAGCCQVEKRPHPSDRGLRLRGYQPSPRPGPLQAAPRNLPFWNYPPFWRVWGWAGATTSLAAYLAEYFPHHLGLRLEVNHPLYAAAWLGAAQLGAWAMERSGAAHPYRPTRFLLSLPPALAATLLAAPLCVLVLGGSRVFSPADPFLQVVHLEHIREFRGLRQHLAGLSWLGVLQSTSALPLLLFPATLLLLSVRFGSGRHSAAARWAALTLAGVAFAGGGGWLWAAAGGGGAALVTLALVVAVAGGAGWRTARHGALAPPAVAILATAAVPAAVLLLLTLWQVRWLGPASVGLLALGAAMLGPVTPSVHRRGRFIAALLALLILVPFPLSTALLPWRFGYPARDEMVQLVARDAAWWIRATEGPGEIVVAAPPTTTTWLLWFGGFRGIGTWYWENGAGLKAAATLFGADSEEAVRRMLNERRVTHLFLPSWEMAALPAERSETGGSSGRAPLPYLQRLQAGEASSPWLQPLPYPPPPLPGPQSTRLLLFRFRPAPDR